MKFTFFICLTVLTVSLIPPSFAYDWRDAFPFLYIYDELLGLKSNSELQESITVNPIKIYVQNIPEYSHNSITLKVIDDALYSWEALNPQLKFKILDNSAYQTWYLRQNSDISIKWVTSITNPSHLLGQTETTVSAYEDGSIVTKHEILIDLIDVDCDGNPIHWDADTITLTIRHEIGHALGILDHSSDPNNIMFSDVDGKNIIDTNGYVVPKKNTEPHYIGQGESTDKECFEKSTTEFKPYN